MNQCITCNKETINPKFCSKSCSAKHNNLGNRRHGNGPTKCIKCGNETSSSQRKYCSRKCSAEDRKKDPKLVSASNAARQARYRAMYGYNRSFALNANKEKIKKIYENCPDGYEVDHIIPLSKGGLHHEDNLQYLTIAENRSKGNRL